MKNFRVCYSGASFENGDSPEQVEEKVLDKVASLGELLEAMILHPDEGHLVGEDYIVSFESEMTIGAEAKELAESQACPLCPTIPFRQITVVAFKKEEDSIT